MGKSTRGVNIPGCNIQDNMENGSGERNVVNIQGRGEMLGMIPIWTPQLRCGAKSLLPNHSDAVQNSAVLYCYCSTEVETRLRNLG